MLLEGRVGIVVGGGSRRGIGRATALTLAREGADVVVADLNLPGAEETAAAVRERGRRALALAVDITSEEQTTRMVAEALAHFGHIDILANCAGITRPTPVTEISVAEWDLVLDIDLKGVFLCIKAVLPAMIAQHYGRIVSISSVSGKQGGGVFGSAHYCAAKAGVAGFTKAVARQMAGYGITANAIAPGLIDTDITVGLVDPETRALYNERAISGILLGRPGKPEEVADLLAFLVSERAGYITGEEMDINGGLHID
ncbi:MAG: SDR family NAD(P)-dependent oxidoreductase [Chloroflexota bacterium]